MKTFRKLNVFVKIIIVSATIFFSAIFLFVGSVVVVGIYEAVTETEDETKKREVENEIRKEESKVKKEKKAEQDKKDKKEKQEKKDKKAEQEKKDEKVEKVEKDKRDKKAEQEKKDKKAEQEKKDKKAEQEKKDKKAEQEKKDKKVEKDKKDKKEKKKKKNKKEEKNYKNDKRSIDKFIKEESNNVDTVELEDNELILTFYPKELWDENTLMKVAHNMFEDMKIGFEEESVDSIKVVIETMMIDEKGNESVSPVLTYIYSRNYFEELNYSNFLDMSVGEEWRILNESESYFIHPGIRKNLKEKYKNNLR